jgi:hypothetical protein
MTQLLSSQLRVAANIVTPERAAVWSGLQLKSVLSGTPAVPAIPASSGNPAVPAKAAVPANATYNKLFKVSPQTLLEATRS